MRVFYLNPENVVTQKTAAKMAKVSARVASREIKLFLTTGFLKKDTFFEEITTKKGKKIKSKKIHGFVVTETFPFFSALRNLVISALPFSREEILNFFKKYRKIKLVCVGGVFMNSSFDEQVTDMLIVGNGIKRGVLERFIKKLEPDVGKEINWTILSLAEFNERLAMHDKFLRDFFDSPNERLINKIEGAQ